MCARTRVRLRAAGLPHGTFQFNATGNDGGRQGVLQLSYCGLLGYVSSASTMLFEAVKYVQRVAYLCICVELSCARVLHACVLSAAACMLIVDASPHLIA